MRKGYKRELQIEDVYKQRRCDESERLTDRLEREYNLFYHDELEYCAKGFVTLSRTLDTINLLIIETTGTGPSGRGQSFVDIEIRVSL